MSRLQRRRHPPWAPLLRMLFASTFNIHFRLSLWSTAEEESFSFLVAELCVHCPATPAEEVRIRQLRVHRVEGYGSEADATPKSANHRYMYVHTSARTGVTYRTNRPRYLEDLKGGKRKKRYISVCAWLGDSFRLPWDRIVLDFHRIKWDRPVKGSISDAPFKNPKS